MPLNSMGARLQTAKSALSPRWHWLSDPSASRSMWNLGCRDVQTLDHKHSKNLLHTSCGLGKTQALTQHMLGASSSKNKISEVRGRVLKLGG